MTIDVLLEGRCVPIDHKVFVTLLGNSVVNSYAPYRDALSSGSLKLAVLIELARKAEVPWSLFFAPIELVRAQQRAKTARLLQGVSSETFTVNSRTVVELRDIELIVKDLLNKQALLRKHDDTLVRNPLIGLLRKSRGSLARDAEALLEVVELDRREIWSLSNHQTALELVIAKLEAKQVLVSRSVRGYMPQLIKVHFSGMTVRDSKVPYIFLAGGDHEDYQEPVGRQMFTLMLMAVLIGRGIFAPVTYDAQSTAPEPGLEYDLVGEILMPAIEINKFDLGSMDALEVAARRFKVTPSAMTVRAMRLGVMRAEVGLEYLAELEEAFRNRGKQRFGAPNRFNAVRKYGSRELSIRLLGAVDRGTLPAREFCRVVSLNRLRPAQLVEFRQALG